MYCDKARIQCYDNNKHLNTVKPNNKQTHERRQTGFLLTQKHKEALSKHTHQYRTNKNKETISKHTLISNKQKQRNDLQTHTNTERTKTKKQPPNTSKYQTNENKETYRRVKIHHQNQQI